VAVVTEYQFIYDDHTVIVADVEVVTRESLWPSRPAQPTLAVKNFSIVVYIGGTDYDLTSGFRPEHRDYFVEWFKAQVREKHMTDLIADSIEEAGA
jgi:hypothetical protein